LAAAKGDIHANNTYPAIYLSKSDDEANMIHHAFESE
jgi:hypothetical protein